MFTSPFWLAADSYPIHPVATGTGSTLRRSVAEKLNIICFKLARELDDPDSCRALPLRAEIVSDASTTRSQTRGLDEQERVKGRENLST